MTKKSKLLTRLLSKPKDFKWRELVKIMKSFGYKELKTGKTGGSRGGFINNEGITIKMHKPHGSKALLSYQIYDILNFLKMEKLI